MEANVPYRQTSPIHLLWTGGWDSTYRLLDVVLRHRHPVQPWYVVDRERVSTPVEEAVMATIREAVRARNDATAEHILPTRRVEREAIAPHEELSRMHKTFAIGSQYGWLARLAEQEELTRLELGARLRKILDGNLERIPGRAGDTYRLVADPENEALELFRRFEFPIATLSKAEMQRRAERYGFLDLMRLTWFCHTPKGGKPCGMCTPCMRAIETEMAWRIPPLRRIRPRLRIVKIKVREGLGVSQ